MAAGIEMRYNTPQLLFRDTALPGRRDPEKIFAVFAISIPIQTSVGKRKKGVINPWSFHLINLAHKTF